jgi:hypothetical protein
LELDLVTEEAMQSAPDIHLTLLDMLHSSTGGHHPYSAQMLCHSETITSASQLEAHLQAAPKPGRAVSRKLILLSSQPVSR